MSIAHKDNTYTILVYSVNVMTHMMALKGGQSGQGIFEPITPILYAVRLTMLHSGALVMDYHGQAMQSLHRISQIKLPAVSRCHVMVF